MTTWRVGEQRTPRQGVGVELLSGSRTGYSTYLLGRGSGWVMGLRESHTGPQGAGDSSVSRCHTETQLGMD
jgi:hypothetical protein